MIDIENSLANTAAADSFDRVDSLEVIDIVEHMEFITSTDYVSSVDTAVREDLTNESDGIDNTVSVKSEPNPFKGILLGLFISLILWALIFRIIYYIGK